ncbi:phospholipid carrier-dependent glycosyltransferase [Aldersonia sp. NBC_00410]|uniref:phospholipid carrier-dependent glycosyltransferase n=1 Tax=Aldersonia sp. NBC_00410 TaxID=2975954 RepID=UPI002252FE44|nr:phospholipid carrier-dependent glycosyltransferase [Aldersonia sp. NBC_00410]MCX5042079.1 phospholipid carrier-dependent glycosyltransferase [Aldersonia sp. NBC_00410]
MRSDTAELSATLSTAAGRRPVASEDRRLTVGIGAVLVLVCGIATAINLSGYPARFGDEGTYVAQAWAVPHLGELAHYTYWYDHPPMGWLQMSVWAEVTGAWTRWQHNTTMIGREFVLFARMVSCAMLFVLARRIGMRRFWAAAAVVLFVFSPLAMHYGRLALLDNIAMPWVLAAFVLALSPRCRWSAAIGSALCFAMAVTTKETLVLLLPALLLALWQNYRDSANRAFAFTSFAIVGALSVAMYPLYAVVKHELFSGAGHVSLVDAMRWQLGERAGSGSVFDAGSDANNLVRSWLELDAWLPVAGVVAGTVLLCYRRFRPLMLALLLQLLMLLRTGYLPAMYVVMLTPLLALAIAGLCDQWWPRTSDPPSGRRAGTVLVATATVAVAVFWTLSLTWAGPAWQSGVARQWTTDADAPQRDAVAWLRDHVPHDAVLVSEAELWLDLHNAGFVGDNNVWVYKVDSDPAVAEQLGGWQRIEYLALSKATLDSQNPQTMPWVFEAITHAVTVRSFGSGQNTLTVMAVTPG